MSDVVDLPKSPQTPLLVGPFSEYRVMVDGRIIPGLTGWRKGDLTWLCVDHRFASPFPHEYASNAASLIAQAMAIASGYPHLGAESQKQPFAPLGMAI